MNSKRVFGRVARYGLLGALCLIFAFPLLWMVSYSLRSVALPPPVRLEFFAPPIAFENYARVLGVLPLLQYMGNSLKVVALAVPLTVLFASWTGFALAQVSRRVRVPLLALSVALLLVPAPALWVPRFLLFAQLGWIYTFAPLIAPALMGTSPFYAIMFYIAFARIPLDLYESARLDGAHPLTVWYALALPLARPTLVAVTLLSAVAYWSNFVDPLLYLRSEANYTLPVGVQILEQAIKANWPLLMAGAVLMAAPVVLLFGFTQRLFLQGQDSLVRWLR
ncbi:MAG: carbohydrate ABC transporter permease [Chloroflexi bacterium]|nr:carbohydrate ABC transporter permease [Chloroflexota bacterium]